MSLCNYIPKHYLESDEVYIYCPCCGEQYELTESEIEDLKFNNYIEYSCPNCGQSFYVECYELK